MNILFMTLAISLIAISGIACRSKDKSLISNPDMIAYEQLESNARVQMQPKKVTIVTSPVGWITYPTPLGIKISIPPDWELIQMDNHLEIKHLHSAIVLKYKPIDDNPDESSSEYSSLLSSVDFSSYKQLDKILTAKLPEEKAFSSMNEKEKRSIYSLFGKKIFFFERFDVISFMTDRFYLFESQATSETMAIVFLNGENKGVVHVGGKWEDDVNDLLSFLANIHNGEHGEHQH